MRLAASSVLVAMNGRVMEPVNNVNNPSCITRHLLIIIIQQTFYILLVDFPANTTITLCGNKVQLNATQKVQELRQKIGG
jgi:hypothetical protein